MHHARGRSLQYRQYTICLVFVSYDCCLVCQHMALLLFLSAICPSSPSSSFPLYHTVVSFCLVIVCLIVLTCSLCAFLTLYSSPWIIIFARLWSFSPSPPCYLWLCLSMGSLPLALFILFLSLVKSLVIICYSLGLCFFLYFDCFDFLVLFKHSFYLSSSSPGPVFMKNLGAKSCSWQYNSKKILRNVCVSS